MNWRRNKMNIFNAISLLIVHNLPKAVILLTGLFFSGIIVNNLEKNYLSKISQLKIYRWFKFVGVISLGLIFRLSFAFYLKGGFDLNYWYEIVNLTIRGYNIYAVSSAYNYFPIWIVILTNLKRINLFLLPQLHFYFIIRLFLTFSDLITLYFLILILRVKHQSENFALFGYFLNPVIITITGFHGQFEGLAVLFIIIGYYLYLYKKNRLAWLFYTIGGLTKHMFVNQILILLAHIYKDKKRIFLYFVLSGLIGILILIPYYPAYLSIINNLFLYSYTTNNYGIPGLLNWIHLSGIINFYRDLFMLSFLGLPFLIRGKSLSEKMLWGSLFFIVFTPGIGDQYFVIPIALAIININFWFYLYSLLTILYLLGSSAQFNVGTYKIFSFNFIWLTALFWFILETYKIYQKND